MDIAGHKVPTWGVWAAAGGGVLIFWQLRKAGSGSGSVPGNIDPATGLPASMDQQVDPATGLTYLAEAQQYGSVSAAEASVSGANLQSVGGGGYYGDVGYPAGYSPGAPSPAAVTDSAWAQQVQATLSAIGYDPQTIASATGQYLARLPLSNSAANLVRVATAEVGPPPVGTYPVIAQPSTAAPAPAPAPVSRPAAPGGLYAVPGTNDAHLSWAAVTHADRYRVRVWTATRHVRIVADTHTAGTALTVPGLQPRTRYGWHVQALDAAGGGPWSGNAHFTTK